MDQTKYTSHNLVREQLKVLLLHLAAKSDNPSYDLQILLREVIDELHSEIKDALNKKPPHLSLVASQDPNSH